MSFAAEAEDHDGTAQPPPLDPAKDPRKTVIVNFDHHDEEGVAIHALGCPWICGPRSSAQDHGWNRFAWEDICDRGDLYIMSDEHGESCCRHLLERFGIADSMVTFFATEIYGARSEIRSDFGYGD